MVSTRAQDSGNELAPPDKHVIGTSIIGVKVDAVTRSPLLMSTLAVSEMRGVSMIRAKPTMGDGALVTAIVSDAVPTDTASTRV